jgi:hypothetical protein
MKCLRLTLSLLLAAFVALPLAAASKDTALDRYVHAADPSFKCELANTIEGEGQVA